LPILQFHQLQLQPLQQPFIQLKLLLTTHPKARQMQVFINLNLLRSPTFLVLLETEDR
jgi:hypothetical protein